VGAASGRGHAQGARKWALPVDEAMLKVRAEVFGGNRLLYFS
jgi:hypothetical protein